MAYQVLARKWRPQRFADVLGQEHITRTLQNAIQRQRVGHAYLFVGPRGIGKTTSARIFAKALNCLQPVTDEQGHLEPCCACLSCQEIAAGNCLDVIEIDGASNNGVENIRELRETVQYAPTHGRSHKVYIIDEVHMLTAGAWNALLKTLEEPPPHVKFLFATTEAHKVLPTILSRCQRFDLKRLSVPLIVRRLRQIADEEQLHVADDALTVIARAADGGMRDAQSSFDQMIAFCGGDADTPITEADVVDVFGLTSSAELHRIARALLANHPGDLIAAIHLLADKGRNLERFYADTLAYLRNLMVSLVVDEPGRILDLGEGELQELAQLGADANATIVQRLVEGLLANDGSIRYTLNKRVFLEVTYLRVMREAHAARLDDVLRRLKHLREKGELDDIARLPAAAVAPPPAMPPRPLPPPPASPAGRPATDRDAAPPTPAPATDDEEDGPATPFAPAPPRPALATAPPPPSADDPPRFADDEVDELDEPATPFADEPPASRGEEPEAPPRPASAYVLGDDNRQQAAALWEQVVGQARADRTTVAEYLDELVPLAIRGQELIVGLPRSTPDEHREQLQSFRTGQQLGGYLHGLTAPRPLRLAMHTVLVDFDPRERDRQRHLVASTEVWQRLQNHPVVQRIVTLFDGRIVDVRG